MRNKSLFNTKLLTYSLFLLQFFSTCQSILIKCPHGCKSCQDCKLNDKGKYEEGCRCTECYQSNRLERLKCIKCGADFCMNCNNRKGWCQRCLDGYYLSPVYNNGVKESQDNEGLIEIVGFSCEKCTSNCKVCSGVSQCDKCNLFFDLAKDSKICVRNYWIESCLLIIGILLGTVFAISFYKIKQKLGSSSKPIQQQGEEKKNKNEDLKLRKKKTLVYNSNRSNQGQVANTNIFGITSSKKKDPPNHVQKEKPAQFQDLNLNQQAPSFPNMPYSDPIQLKSCLTAQFKEVSSNQVSSHEQNQRLDSGQKLPSSVRSREDKLLEQLSVLSFSPINKQNMAVVVQKRVYLSDKELSKGL